MDGKLLGEVQFNQSYCCLEKEFNFSDTNIVSCAWSNDGKRFALLQDTGDVYIYDSILHGIFTHRMHFKHKGAHSLCWTNNGGQIASLSYSGLLFWSSKTGDLETKIKIESGDKALCFDCSPMEYGSIAIACHHNNTILLKNHKKERLGALVGHGYRITHIKYHSSGKRLASGTEYGTVGIWHSREEQENEGPVDNQLRISSIKHSDSITGLEWLPGSDVIVSSAKDNRIIFLDTNTNKTIKIMDEIDDPIIGITFDPLGHFLIVKVFDNTIRILKLPKDIKNSKKNDNLTDFVQVRTLSEKSCIKRSMIVGNPKFDYFATLNALSNETVKSHLWRIDYSELTSEDKWTNSSYRAAKVLAACLDETSLDTMDRYLKSNGFFTENNKIYHSLGKVERCINSNVVELIEPVLWWKGLSVGVSYEEACFHNNVSLHFNLVSIHCLLNSQEFNKTKKNIAINITCARSPVILGVVHGLDTNKETRDEIEIKIKQSFSDIDIVWLDLNIGDSFGEIKNIFIESINWNVQPRAINYSSVTRLKHFYENRNERGYIATYLSEDYRLFKEFNYIKMREIVEEREFKSLIKCLDFLGFLKQFPQKNQSIDRAVCLDLPRVRHYMEAIYLTASQNQMGRIPYKKCYAADFAIDSDYKVNDHLQEVCLIDSILALLENVGLVHKVYSGDGAFWVFPSVSCNVSFDAEDNMQVDEVFEIDGLVKDAYAYSLTKLSGSVIFHSPQLYRDLAIFSNVSGGLCIIKLVEEVDGKGKLHLCSIDASEHTIFTFIKFVRKNLQDVYFINNITASSPPRLETTAHVLPKSDIFISYCSDDVENVKVIAQALEEKDLDVWYDKELIAGDVVQEELISRLNSTKAVLILLGENMGVWQKQEIMHITNLATNHDVRVIPGILPHFNGDALPTFLANHKFIDFRVLGATPIEEIVKALDKDR